MGFRLLAEGSCWNSFDRNEGALPLHVASCSSVACVRELLDWRLGLWKGDKAEDVLFDTRDRDGRTALMYASMCGSLECAEYLIEKGGKRLIAYYAYCEHETALMMASREGLIEIVKLLLERGGNAQINTKNIDGETALMLASRKGHTEVVNCLEAAGASR